jgi:hypothetical protein
MSMTHDEMITVITAHKNGEKIQALRGSIWTECEKPSFNFMCHDYRVAPVVEAWGVLLDGELICCSYHKGDAEISVSLEPGTLIRLIPDPNWSE